MTPTSSGDDRELLRDNGADPYLFILLDTSMSMALQLDGTWAEANGNDPRSRLYLAKKALYEVLNKPDYENIRFGFATFGQDQVRVGSKHWLYYPEDPAENAANTTPLADLQADLGYPTSEPGNEVEVSTAEIVDIDGDMMTFGKTYVTPAVAGTCAAPLNLRNADDRQRVNRFSRLGVDSNEDTRIWVSPDLTGNPPTYRLTFSNANPAVALGSATINVTIKAERVVNCVDPVSGVVAFDGSPVEGTVSFRLWRDFLMTDDSGGEVVFEKSGVGAGGGKKCDNDDACEETGGWWDFRDVEGLFTCGDSKPFSGGGWEGNYDTGDPFTTNPTFENGLIPGNKRDLVDTYCSDSNDPATCELLLDTTTYDASINRRELDRGDMLPFHWTFRNREQFFRRLNPNRDVDASNPQYGAAYYFENTPTAHCTGAGTPTACCTGLGTGTCTTLQLRAPYRGAGNPPDFAPIVPAGISPVSDSILDFRCWYVGPNNKCGRGELDQVYTKGFRTLLEENDLAAFRCRQPYLIVISDMASNCPNNSPVAQVAGMNTETRDGNIRSTGVSTWVLNVGTGSVSGLTNSGKGEEIKIDTKDKLAAVLDDILGIIQESTRSFSSAAVPTAQADVEEKIYVTQFTPRQDKSVWQGRVLAFTKPLPTAQLDPNDPAAGVAPDLDHENFNWDAGEEMKAQAPPATLAFDPNDPDGFSRSDLKLGSGTDQRRVYYAIQDSAPLVDADGDLTPDNDQDTRVPRVKFLLGPAEGSAPSGMDLNDVRKDMWKGLDVITSDFFTFTSDPGNMTDLFTQHAPIADVAHTIFAETYKIKVAVDRDENGVPLPDADQEEYVLGDIFHATPLLVGNPTNARYLSRAEPGDPFEGYIEYAGVQAKRRKVLFVASDDGQVHAFEAGRFQGSLDDGSFNNGTGKELFAVAPRAALPTIALLAKENTSHRWGVDGTPVAADVKIDAAHGGRGSADPPDPDERQWRTVLIGGMRRGGDAYYALDVSRPDRMVEETVTVAGRTFSLGFKPVDGSQELPGCFLASGDPVNNPGDCDPTGFNYPEILWEFTDTDMGQTWSTPDIGAIKVTENGSEVVKFVAVVGGGMDPDGLTAAADNPKGSKLYIVDIETGAMLYKRDLAGAAAASPAAVDTDQDGFLDRVYIGTTEGLMYRANIGTSANVVTGGSCPATPPAGSTDSCCASAGGPVNGCVVDPAWEPYEFFDTGTTETDADNVTHFVRKPIFFAPAVIFVSRLNNYALAFGTGERHDLWAPAPLGGNRFYLVVDEDLDPADLPLDQTNIQEVTAPVGLEADLLIDPEDGFDRGWFITLGTIAASDENFGVANEKVLTQTTAVAGLTVFSTFVPEILTTQTGSGNSIEIRCARRGISRVYAQFASNGEPIPPPENPDPNAPPPAGGRVPEEVSTLVSEPFIEEAAGPCPGTEGMDKILMDQLFPPTCKFTAKRWNLSAMRADTGIECFAQIPVCLVEKNWKDY